MAKQSKRTRKFETKGGIKASLGKGTITCKGKLKRRGKKRKVDVDESAIRKAKQASNEQQRMEHLKKAERDFTSEANLGDLDLESFFEKTINELSEKSPGGNDKIRVTKDQAEEKKGKTATPQTLEVNAEKGGRNDGSDGDSSNSDSDDEDVHTAAERMEREMNKLGKTDPEFEKFLQQNEDSLLDFEAEDNSDEEDVAEEEQPENKEGSVEVTNAFLDKLEQGAFNSHGIKPLKKLLSVYNSACHMFDSDQSNGGDKRKMYHIESSKIFDRVMMMTLTQCHEEFSYHLVGEGSQDPSDKKDGKKSNDKDEGDEGDTSDVDEDTPLNPKKIMRSKRWAETKGSLQSFFKSTVNVLMEGKDPEHLTFILKALGKYIPFLTPMPIMAQNLLRTLTSLWSAPLDSSVDYQVVRLNAFIRIRQMAITQPYPFIEDCLKKTYLSYAKRAKYGTSAAVTSVLPTLTFMGNCIVELYSLDFHSSYQHAFIYIRQLALHLRGAMQKKTPEAFQVVYCWQYIHCLKLWTAVLAQSCKMSKNLEVNSSSDAKLLHSLIYPLTEVIQGVMRLVPTTRHLPLRLHCVRYLQQLASASEKFIPTTAVLLETLELKEIMMKPKRDKSREASRGIKLPIIIKLPKENALRSLEQLEACVSEIFLLLNREVDLYRYSPGFPEFTTLICQRLRKFTKLTRNGRWRAYAKGCIELCQRYAQLAKSERTKLKEAPKDIKRLEALKPTSTPSMGERYEAAIAKEKRLEKVARPAMKVEKKKGQKRRSEDTDVDEQVFKHPIEGKAEKKKKVEKLISEKEALEQEDEVAEGIDWSDDEIDEEDSSE